MCSGKTPCDWVWIVKWSVAGVVFGKAGSQFHRVDDDPWVVQCQLRDVGRTVERGLDGGLVALEIVQHNIIGDVIEQLRRAFADGDFRICHRGQRFDVDRHSLGRVACLSRCGGGDAGDAFAGEAHAIHSEGIALRRGCGLPSRLGMGIMLLAA